MTDMVTEQCEKLTFHAVRSETGRRLNRWSAARGGAQWSPVCDDAFELMDQVFTRFNVSTLEALRLVPAFQAMMRNGDTFKPADRTTVVAPVDWCDYCASKATVFALDRHFYCDACYDAYYTDGNAKPADRAANTKESD